MIAIAYHTADPFYSAAGDHLAKNLAALGMPCAIISITAKGRTEATRHKPKFIANMLMQHQQDVWFFDVDSRLKSIPPAVPPDKFMAVHYQPAKTGFPVRSNALFFRHGSKAIAFLMEWRKQCAEEENPKVTDHTPLIRAWNGLRSKLDVGLMDFNAWHVGNGFKDQPHPIHGYDTPK